MNSRTLVIVFLTCVLLSMTSGALIIQPQCRCKAMQKTPIRFERIQKFVTIAPGPHCKDLQVIATLKFKKGVEACVNPSDKWVQDAMKKMGLVKQISADTRAIA